MAWLGLLATIGWNFRQYRRGRLTICALTRRLLPRAVAAGVLVAVFTYLEVHIWRGYPRT